MTGSSPPSIGRRKPPPPLDPQEFIDLGIHIGTTGSTAAHKRAAIGRIYYGLLLLAVERTGYSGSRRKIRHHELLQEVRNRTKKFVGDQFFDLKELREVADYQSVPYGEQHWDWDHNWNRARRILKDIYPSIDELDS